MKSQKPRLKLSPKLNPKSKNQRKLMTNRLALTLIKKNRPKTHLETQLLGLKLVHLGTGAFRAVYRIKGTDFVIKFLTDGFFDEHSRDEVNNIKKLAKSKSLRPHLPRIHYYDPKLGVIVMNYYTRYNKTRANKPHPARAYGDITWERVLISDLIKELTGVNFSDLWDENLRMDKNDVVKFVDVGC